MKRVLVVLLVLILCGTAVADSEWSGYSDDELQAMIDELSGMVSAAQAELDSRHSAAGSNSGIIGKSFDFKGETFMITNIYKCTYHGDNLIALEFDWTNTGDGPTSLSFTGINTKAFQNGRECEWSVAGFDDDRYTDILPGYSSTNYLAHKLTDNSEVTIIMSDVFDWGKDSITFTVNPSTLPTLNV